MATNIVYAEYVKWLTQYMGKHCFIVMWSDGTWDKFSSSGIMRKHSLSKRILG